MASCHSIFLFFFLSVILIAPFKQVRAEEAPESIDDDLMDSLFDDDDSDEHDTQPSPPLAKEEEDENVDIDAFLDAEDDEEGSPAPSKRKTWNADNSEEKKKAARRPVGFGMPIQDSYVFETIALCCVAIYMILFFIGRATNEKIARVWLHAVSDLAQQNFSLIGDSRAMILKESLSDFRLYASGRRGCTCVNACLKLRKRQDLVSTALSLVFPKRDRLILEATLGATPSLVFLACKESLRRKLTTDLQDVGKLCARVGHESLPASLAVSTEHPDLFPPILLHSGALRHLKAHERSFVSLYITDSPYSKSERRVTKLRMEFALPALNAAAAPVPAGRRSPLAQDSPLASPASSELAHQHAGFTADAQAHFTLFLQLIDALADLKITRDAKARLDKHRQAVADEARRSAHQQRQEASQKRKEERIRRENEEMKGMSQEQQRKIEARRAKQQQRKQNQSKKVKVVFS